jgi:hypothetical protein
VSGGRHNHVNRVRGGAEDRADLGHRLDWVQHADRKAFAQHHDETVPGADGLRVAGRQFHQVLVVAGAADQASAGRLAERHAEAQLPANSNQCLVEILDSLDECAWPMITLTSSAVSTGTTSNATAFAIETSSLHCRPPCGRRAHRQRSMALSSRRNIDVYPVRTGQFADTAADHIVQA